MNFKKLFSVILIFCITTLPCNILASEQEIVKAINAVDGDANIGIKIRNLKTNKVVYQQNGGRYYNFASAIKIFTVYSFIKYFGLDYKFSSKLLKKYIDYYLDINDPNFSTSDLESLINKLKEVEGSNIKGNFYIVDNKFSVPEKLDGRMVEDAKYCYGAPLTKTHINKNCLKLKAKAASAMKDPITLKTIDLTPYKIVNKSSTIPDGKEPKVAIEIRDKDLEVSGTLNSSCGELTIGAVVHNPIAHIQNMIRGVFEKLNISIDGEILLSSPWVGATMIAEVNKDIAEIAIHTLKKSDNFMSDYLLAELGTRYGKQDWRNCGELLKKLVSQKFNIDFTKTTIIDGSGLSRHNAFTVEHFDQFLTALYKDPDFDKFLLMLEQPGERYILQNNKNLKIFFKTGYMTGITSIVGYAFDRNDVPYSIVIVINNFWGARAKYLELEENILSLAIPH